MRDVRALIAVAAMWGTLFQGQASATFYYTPTRQKAAQSRPPAVRVTPRSSARPVAPKSNDMLALEALEKMPVPVAPKRVPAAQKPIKPAAAQKSADSMALDSLVGSP